MKRLIVILVTIVLVTGAGAGLNFTSATPSSDNSITNERISGGSYTGTPLESGTETNHTQVYFWVIGGCILIFGVMQLIDSSTNRNDQFQH